MNTNKNIFQKSLKILILVYFRTNVFFSPIRFLEKEMLHHRVLAGVQSESFSHSGAHPHLTPVKTTPRPSKIPPKDPFHSCVRNIPEAHGISRKHTEYPGSTRNFPEAHGISRKHTEYPGSYCCSNFRFRDSAGAITGAPSL